MPVLQQHAIRRIIHVADHIARIGVCIEQFDLPVGPRAFKKEILTKITTLNMGIEVIAVPGLKNSKAAQALLEVSRILDGVIFSNANSFFPIKNGDSALFTNNKDVILSDTGYSEVNDLDVIIESKHYFTPDSNQN
jgi:hypothetical protein